MAQTLPEMIAQDLRPHGAVEALFAAGANLPGKLGWICFRKLKRRMAVRGRVRFMEIAASLGKGDIAIDLGANVGELTELLAANGATVHAFEPEPQTFSILQEKFGALHNVHLHNAAVSDFDGTTELILPASFADIPRSASKAASIAYDRYKNDEVPAVTVPVVDFSRFLTELEVKARLIKVDIEGAEWDLLRGIQNKGALDKFDMMFVETHERFDLSILPFVKQQQNWAAEQAAPYINLYWT